MNNPTRQYKLMEDDKKPEVTDDNRRIVELIVRQHILDSIIKQVTNNSKDEDLSDLFQDLLYSLLLDSKLSGIYERGELNFYLSRIVMNNIASATSPYYRIYKRPVKLNDRFYLSNRKNQDELYEPPKY